MLIYVPATPSNPVIFSSPPELSAEQRQRIRMSIRLHEYMTNDADTDTYTHRRRLPHWSTHLAKRAEVQTELRPLMAFDFEVLHYLQRVLGMTMLLSGARAEQNPSVALLEAIQAAYHIKEKEL